MKNGIFIAAGFLILASFGTAQADETGKMQISGLDAPSSCVKLINTPIDVAFQTEYSSAPVLTSVKGTAVPGDSLDVACDPPSIYGMSCKVTSHGQNGNSVCAPSYIEFSVSGTSSKLPANREGQVQLSNGTPDQCYSSKNIRVDMGQKMLAKPISVSGWGMGVNSDTITAKCEASDADFKSFECTITASGIGAGVCAVSYLNWVALGR